MINNANKIGNNAGIAAVLSFIFTGLGQVYNGHIAKGLFLMFITIITMMITVLGAVIVCYAVLRGSILGNNSILGITLMVVGLVTMVIVGIYNIYDAYNTAKRIESK